MGQFRVGQKGVKWDKKRCRNCVRTINGRKKSNIHMGQFSAGTKIGRTKSVANNWDIFGRTKRVARSLDNLG